MSHDNEKLLKKDVSFTVALALVVGSVIGSGIFMKPGKVIAAAGDSNMALLAWVLGGLITLTGGLTLAELGVQIPKTGGLYVYIEEIYGSVWGYICGWVHTLIYGPAVIGAVSLYLGSLTAFSMGWHSHWKIPLAIFYMIFLGTINSMGTRYAGRVQTVVTSVKLIPIILIAVFGLSQGHGNIWNMPSGMATHLGMGAAILATLWAYDGWMLVSFVAGEMKDPGRILPRAIVFGLLIVMVAYLSVNMALLHTLPAQQIAALSENAASRAASVLFGSLGGRLISLGIMISMFGTLNGKLMTFPRLPFAMAERDQLPFSGLWSRVNVKSGTPNWAIGMQIILAATLVSLGDPDRLTDVAVFSVFGFSVMSFIGVFILRKRYPDAPRSYKVPLYPVVPCIAIVGGLYILISTVLDKPMDTVGSILIAIVGLPVLWVLRRNKNKTNK